MDCAACTRFVMEDGDRLVIMHVECYQEMLAEIVSLRSRLVLGPRG